MRAASPSPARTTPSGNRLLVGLLLAAVLLMGAGTAAAFGVFGVPAPRLAAAAPAPLALVGDSAAPAPVALSVPAIGVDVPLKRLGLDGAGAVIPPDHPDEAGWVEVTATPGRPGPAVIAGHVDTRSGPAVFVRLAELQPGDRVNVRLDDGSRWTYVVRRSEQHAKDAFPTAAVYGASPVSTLRLVTCGGTVDAATGHYRDNVVVYADLLA